MFNVGDIVKVREDLYGGRVYNGLFFAENMEKYRGLKAEIIQISYSDGSLGGEQYHLDISGHAWQFNERMLEPFKKNEKLTDIIKRRTSLK